MSIRMDTIWKFHLKNKETFVKYKIVKITRICNFKGKPYVSVKKIYSPYHDGTMIYTFTGVIFMLEDDINHYSLFSD